MNNELMIRVQFNSLLMMQMMALHTLSSVYAEIHPNYSEWRSSVTLLPSRLRDELGADVSTVHNFDPESKEESEVFIKLGFKRFADKYGAIFPSEPD
jgi:hypothetical protein